jgi:hypothetical protein
MSDTEKKDALDPGSAPRLGQVLRAMHEMRKPVPGSVDDRILYEARTHLRRAEENKRVLRFPAWLAWAAAVVLGLGLIFLLRWEGRSPAARVVMREDIDRNGQVDILDAFALALRLQQGLRGDGQGGPDVNDVNTDGVFDQRDIDYVAARAVRLNQG